MARPCSWGISHWMESPTHLPALLWLTPGWVAIQMHMLFKNNIVLKSIRLWEKEKENFPQWDNDRAGHLTGGWRNLRLLWTHDFLPRNLLLFLLEQSLGCVREENSFLWVFRQYWRKNTFKKTFCTSDGCLWAGRWPFQSTLPQETDSNHLAIKYKRCDFCNGQYLFILISA